MSETFSDRVSSGERPSAASVLVMEIANKARNGVTRLKYHEYVGDVRSELPLNVVAFAPHGDELRR